MLTVSIFIYLFILVEIVTSNLLSTLSIQSLSQCRLRLTEGQIMTQIKLQKFKRLGESLSLVVV